MLVTWRACRSRRLQVPQTRARGGFPEAVWGRRARRGDGVPRGADGLGPGARSSLPRPALCGPGCADRSLGPRAGQPFFQKKKKKRKCNLFRGVSVRRGEALVSGGRWPEGRGERRGGGREPGTRSRGRCPSGRAANCSRTRKFVRNTCRGGAGSPTAARSRFCGRRARAAGRAPRRPSPAAAAPAGEAPDGAVPGARAPGSAAPGPAPQLWGAVLAA